jgi:hypothetical protein
VVIERLPSDHHQSNTVLVVGAGSERVARRPIMPPNEPMNVSSGLLELDLQATVQTPISSTHPEIDPYQDQTFGRIDRSPESQDLQHSQQASEIGHLRSKCLARIRSG